MNDPDDPVRRIFIEVMDLQGAERDAAIVRLCGVDDAIRLEVEALLQYDRTDSIEDRTEADGTKALRESGETVGAYRLEFLQGRGGFGEVWKARQFKPVERIVAIKFLAGPAEMKEVRERFEVERQVLATLGHSGIARIIDADALPDGTPWFAMDFIDGEPFLDAILIHELGIDAAVDLLVEVCDAIIHAHRVGVIHLDLKSANILVARLDDGSLRPVVIDFGIARIPLGGEDGSGRMLVGTPGSMSPEQVAGRIDPDTRADVWAIGRLLSLVIDSGPKAGGRRAHELGWIVGRATALDREERYRSVDALRDELRRWRARAPLRESGPRSGIHRLDNLFREHRRLFTIVGALVLSLSVVLAWSIREQRQAVGQLDRAEANRSLVRSFLKRFDRIDAGSLEKVRFKQLLASAVAGIEEVGAADPLLVVELRQAIAAMAFAGGDAELMADQIEKVLRILLVDLRLDPTDRLVMRARFQLVQARYNQGRFVESGSLARSLRGQDPTENARYRLALAASLVAERGDDIEALLILENLDRSESVDSSLRDAIDFSMGRSLVGVGRPDDAIPYFDRAITTLLQRFEVEDPAVLWRRIHRGEALLAAGRIEEAAEVIDGTFIEQLKRVGRDHVNTHWMREVVGDLRLAQGRRGEALLQYRQSLNGRRLWLQPAHPDLADLQEKIDSLENRRSLAPVLDPKGGVGDGNSPATQD